MENLIIQAKKGSKRALKELVCMYNPLIESTALRVYGIFEHKIDKTDIEQMSRQLFRNMVLNEYTIDGRARFPYYAKKMLYAKIIHELRPIYRNKRYDIPIENHRLDIKVPPAVWRRERTSIIYKLLKYVDKTFTKREKKFIDSCILGNKCKADMAKYFGISKQRAAQIYKKVIQKLHDKLSDMGVHKGDL